MLVSMGIYLELVRSWDFKRVLGYKQKKLWFRVWKESEVNCGQGPYNKGWEGALNLLQDRLRI